MSCNPKDVLKGLKQLDNAKNFTAKVEKTATLNFWQKAVNSFRDIILANPSIPAKVLESQTGRVIQKVSDLGKPQATAEILANAAKKTKETFKNAGHGEESGTFNNPVFKGIERLRQFNIKGTHTQIPEAYAEWRVKDLMKNGLDAASASKLDPEKFPSAKDLIGNTLTEGQAKHIAEVEAQEVALMHNTPLSKLYSGARDVLNKVGEGTPLGDIPFGDMAMPIIKVPANAAWEGIKASDLGVFTRLVISTTKLRTNPKVAGIQAAKILGSAALGKTAMLALAGAGLLSGSYDPKTNAQDKNMNIPHTSLNISGLGRKLSGGDASPQPNDFWLQLEHVPAVNQQVKEAVKTVRDLNAGKDPVSILMDRTIQATENLPFAYQAHEFIDTLAGKSKASPGQMIGGALGTVPSTLNREGRSLLGLPKTNTNSKRIEDIGQQATGGIFAPSQKDVFGEDIHYSNSVLGSVSSYHPFAKDVELKTKLSKISEEAGDKAADFWGKDIRSVKYKGEDDSTLSKDLTLGEQDKYVSIAGPMRRQYWDYAVNQSPNFDSLTAEDKTKVLHVINNAINKATLTQMFDDVKRGKSKLVNAIADGDEERVQARIEHEVNKYLRKENKETQ